MGSSIPDNLTMEGHVNIFFIHSSDDRWWKGSYTSFQSALDAVSEYVKKENSNRRMQYDYEGMVPEIKMEKEFGPMNVRGNILVARDSDSPLSFFIQQLTTYPYKDPYTRKSS